MTKNQRTKLVSKIFVFTIVFSLLMVCAPYVVVFMAIYLAAEAAKRT